MKGVYIKKALIVNEDERRKILEISNGLMDIKNLKILFCKKGENILGHHWHVYPELRYVMKGKVEFKLKHVLTKEEMEVTMEEGDVMYTTGFIIHTGKFSEDSIVVDGAAESYIDHDFNDISE